jgi:hypothetical protein
MKECFLHGLAGLGAVALFCGAAPAQQVRDGAPARPGWRPRETRFDYPGATAAEKAYAIARLEQLERVFLDVPELARPDGFELQSTFRGFFHGPPDRTTVLQYHWDLTGFNAFTTFVDHKGCSILEVEVNSGPPNDRVDETGRPVFLERERAQPIPGATVAWEELLPPPDRSVEYVVFTPPGEPPWTPLTREQVRRVQIIDFEGQNGEKTAQYRQALQKTPYERWMDGAAERKKTRDELAASLKAMKSAEEVTKTIKELEKTEREVTENLKAADAEDRKRYQELLATPSVGDQVRAAIEAMSPEERKLPGAIQLGGETGWEVVAPETPHSHRLLRPNPDFWRARRSRAEVRNLNVGFVASCGGAPPPRVIHQALWQAFQKVDWATLKRLVDAQP